MNILPSELKREFKCNGCSKEHEKQFTDLEWDCVESHERSMGLENHYVATMHMDCHCGTNIEIEYHIWEYPVGVINSEDIQITNGTKM